MRILLTDLRRAALLAMGWLTVAGCQEENLPPTADFVSPEPGTTHYPGPVTFQGEVGDSETSATELVVTFDAGTPGQCDATVTEDGMATCDIVFETEGTFTVTLWVMDDIGQKASDETDITIYDAPPSVTLISPDPLSPPVLTEQDVLTLVASVSDTDDDSLTCVWESNIDGLLGTVQSDPITSECSLPDVSFGGGTHTITVTARDAFGKEATASFQLQVTPCTDYDGDGYFAECGQIDCNDADPSTHPGALETCNGRDTDCNGMVDDVDADGDGYSSCFLPPDGDCDDTAYLVHPFAEELCDGVDNDCDGEVDEGFDKDHDGFSSCDNDCDDSDRTVNPDATEVCDNVDNDCDGEIDEGVLISLYYDSDGDGHGDGSQPPAQVCALTEGLSEVGDDCDDSDPEVYPGAAEVCNGKDDDCNGEVDEGTTPLTFYLDEDGDGYGATDSPTEQGCVPPPGYILEPGDCDDDNASIHPGATEICNEVDDNCNGEVDEGATVTYHADADGDGYGAAEELVGCEVPPGHVLNGDDCDDTAGTVHPGAQEMCNDVDDDCNGIVDDQVETYTFYRDEDGDTFGSEETREACAPPEGYVLQDGDCDDHDLSVNPDATEVCNNKDDDCDGNVDENVKLTFWEDADGDGYGGDTTSVMACEAPQGFVESNTDCHDDNPNAYPDAEEACDGIDTNCNGVVDEGFEPLSVFYLDADGDGYGTDAGGAYTYACATPPGYAESNEDCNDSSAQIYPGAPEQANGVDDDCDGVVDEGTQNFDDDGDGFAEADNPGDCDDNDISVYPGANEVLNGKDDNCDGRVDEGSVCGDDDGDGYIERDDPTTCPGYPDAYGDSLLGGSDCNDDDPRVYPGAPELFNGQDESCDGVVDGTIPLGSQEVVLTGDKINAQAGFAVAFLGDLNGDGLNDFGVGAPGRDSRGAVHLLFGKQTGWRSQTLASAGVTLKEDLAGSSAGFALSFADLDNDGFDDLAVGAPYRPSSASAGGTLYIFYGSSSRWTGGFLNELADATADGLAEDTLMGYAISGGCNVNDTTNAVEDLAVGTPWGDSGYLIVLPGSNGKRYTGEIMPQDFAKIQGQGTATTMDKIGLAVAMAHNVNGDEWCDMLVAGAGTDKGLPSHTESGIVYLVPGYENLDAETSSSLDELGAVSFRGRGAYEYVGYDLASAGDVNGDGFDDYLISRKTRTEDTQGVAYLFLGGSTLPDGGAIQQSADAYFMTQESSVCPCTVAGIGDIDGDGYDDIAIGLSQSDVGGTDSGAVYVFYGDNAGWAGQISLDDADVLLEGAPGDMAGSSLDTAGDLNGDGYDDFVIGAPGYDEDSALDAGRVFVMFGFPRT